MAGTGFLYMLLGAALVAIGVLAAALAERIRGHRGSHAATSSPRESRPSTVPVATPVISAVESVGSAVRQSTAAPVVSLKPPRALRAGTEGTEGADDVIAALVRAGYKKARADDAVRACRADERATIEDWTRAALRRCVTGGMA